MRCVRVLFILLTLAASSAAWAQNHRLDRAKQLYLDGKDAYEKSDYQKAYDAFKESYLLSHEPALLYNVSSALQGLRRPHEAAEALRSFLRLRPDDPDRPSIEERIRALEEEQRLLDREKADQAPPLTPPSLPPQQSITPPPGAATAASDAAAVTAESDRDWKRRKRNRIIGAVVGSVLGVAIVGTAIGLAIGLSGSTPPYSMGSIGPVPGTR